METVSIESVEMPKGCLKVIGCIKESQQACISHIMKSTGLSQSAVYSSLDRLRELEVVEIEGKSQYPGTPKLHSLTEKGELMGACVTSMLDTIRHISGKRNVNSYLILPVGSLRILVSLYEKKETTLSDVILKLGVCKGSASSSLRKMMKLGLIHCQRKGRFRSTVLEYELTKDGRCFARNLNMIDALIRGTEGEEESYQMLTYSEETDDK